MMFDPTRLLKAVSKRSVPRRDQRLRTAIESLEVRRMLTAWYVSTTGAATNAGTLSQPFGTIQQAANVAQPGDTVYIFGGVYHETVTPTTSGTAGAPITFEPYNGQSVTIDGADAITGWTSYSGSIYQAPQGWDLGEGNNQVFVDGTMVNEARWPNTPADIAATGSTSTTPANISTPTWATATSVTVTQATAPALSTVTIHNASLSQAAGTWVGSIAHIAAGQEWVDQTGLITASSPGSITVSYYQETSYQVPQAGNRFYIVGNFKALDTAGEWYRDPASGRLYLWDPAGDSPANHTIEAKARDYGFDLSGLSNIDVSDINLFACTINTDANSSNNVLNGISAQYVSQSIGITPDTQNPWGAQNHPHTTGIILNGVGNILENSSIAFSSGDGVFVGGSGNTVENTVIHDVDYEAGDEAGITSLGSDETILDNTIYNAGRSGIVCRFTYASIIAHNVIHNVGLQMTDLGGIYTWGTDGDGTEISYNVIYNVTASGFGAAGIYLDNSSQDFIVDHNLVFNCYNALTLNPPSLNNLIVNNTFVGTHSALGTSGDEAMTGDVIVNNIFAGVTTFGPGATQSNNILSPTNPDFVSTAQSNYQLQAASPAIDNGMSELPYTADYSGSAPDSGAYEYGMVPFMAGASAQPFIPPGATATPPAMPIITWPNPSSIQFGTPLSAVQLDATANVPGTFAYSQGAGTILGAGSSRIVSAIFTPFDSIDYTSATASVAINVTVATPTITWANPADIVYGTALNTTQLNATSPVPGTFVYNQPVGTILGAGAGQTLSATFTPFDSADYGSATASVTMNVTPAIPTVTWPNSPAVLYGTALDSAQLDATSSVPGTFVYTPAAGTIMSPGDGQTLSATFMPSDSIDYASVTATASINIVATPVTPTIAWSNPASIVYGTPLGAAQLDATSSIPGTFIYAPAAGTIMGAGTGQPLSVTFLPTDSVDYNSTSASTTIDVAQAMPTINWQNPSPITYGTALSAAQLDATSPVAGTFSYSLASGTILNAGNGQSLAVTFTPTDTNDYTSTAASTTLNVKTAVLTLKANSFSRPYAAGNPALTFALSGFVNGDTPTVLSGLPTLSTSALSTSAAGMYPINIATAAMSAGNYTFTTVQGSLTVTPAATSTVVTTSGATVFGQLATFTATVIPSSGSGLAGNVQFQVNGINVGLPVALISGKAIYKTAALAAGTQSVTAIYVGSKNFAGSTSKATSQIVNHAVTATTLTASASTTVFGQSFTVTAKVLATAPGSGTPTGTVTFKNGATVLKTVTLVNGVATLAWASLHIGTQNVTAVYSGDSNFIASTIALSHLVKQAATTTIITSSVASTPAGQSLTLTATIKPVSPGAGVPTGTVTFKSGTTLIGTMTLAASKAILTIKTLAKGTQKITATYGGDANFLASVSSAITQLIS